MFIAKVGAVVRRDGKRMVTTGAVGSRCRVAVFVGDRPREGVFVDGISDFDGLDSRKHNYEVQFYAFAMLASNGDNWHVSPLSDAWD